MKKNKTISKRAADVVDKHVGARIEAARHAARITQMELGDTLGVSFQQVQKYEKGTNRVSCGALVAIANSLDVSIDYFFDGAPGLNAGNGTTAKMSEFYSVEGAAKLAADFVRLAPPMRTAVRSLASNL